MDNTPPPPPPPQLEEATRAACGYVCLDTETGGLSAGTNPLLSCALVLCDPAFYELDGFSLEIKPPPGTLLEIPQAGFFGVDPKIRRPVAAYLDLHAWQYLPASAYDSRTSSAPLITSFAAETNHFVELDHTGQAYNLAKAYQWTNQGVSLERAEESFCRFIAQYFASRPYAVAHNASFDERFIKMWMPNLWKNLRQPWKCTYLALKKYRKGQGHNTGKGSAGTCNLQALSKYAGYAIPEGAAHEALADTRGCLAGLRWLVAEGAMEPHM